MLRVKSPTNKNRFPRLDRDSFTCYTGAMSDAELDTNFAQIARRIDPQSRLLRAWELKGGVSAQVTALEIELPDEQTRRLVVRRHGRVDLEHNPHVAADEFKLLQLLHSEGLPTPIPYYLDQSGEIFPRPSIVIEYIEGEPIFELARVPDLIAQFATYLLRIHRLDCTKIYSSFLPIQESICSEMLRKRPTSDVEDADEERLRAALKDAWPFSRQNTPVLLHGDFWPGNILWRDGRLVGILDWEDARVGDPLADVANSRLEILWAFGVDAMRQFTHRYQAMTTSDFTNLPYWDLFAAFRSASQFAAWAADDEAAKNMRERHQWFMNQAFETLSSSGRI